MHLPVLRYVDDYIAPEMDTVAKHGLDCFARLVRIILGQSCTAVAYTHLLLLCAKSGSDAIAAEKMESGKQICVLGVDFDIRDDCFICKPAAAKVSASLQYSFALALHAFFYCQGQGMDKNH